jgi:hypothetical protein
MWCVGHWPLALVTALSVLSPAWLRTRLISMGYMISLIVINAEQKCLTGQTRLGPVCWNRGLHRFVPTIIHVIPDSGSIGLSEPLWVRTRLLESSPVFGHWYSNELIICFASYSLSATAVKTAPNPRFSDRFSVATPGVKTCHKICGILNLPPNWSHAREMLGSLQQRWLVLMEFNFRLLFISKKTVE